MDRIRYPRAALAAFLAAASLTAGCGAPHQTVTAAASPSVLTTSTQGTPTLPPPAVRDGGHGGRGGSANGTPSAANALPADWPLDVPVPAGDIMGSTGSAGRWSVLKIGRASCRERV